jgi:flagellar hook-length control protein FliK
MNATPPVFQAQRSNDVQSTSASASTGSQAAPANSQDFAGALSEANGKPARKAVTSKSHDVDSGGRQLPPAGNRAPVASTPPPPARTDAASTNPANGAAGGQGTSGPAAVAGAAGAAAAAGANAAGTGALGLPPGAMPPGTLVNALANAAPNAQPMLNDASAAIMLPTLGTGTPAADGSAPNSPGATPNAAATVPMLGAAAAAAPTARLVAGAGNAAVSARPVEGTAGKAAVDAAASTPTSADASTAGLTATPDGGPALGEADAAAQAAMAAANADSAAATAAAITQGTSAPAEAAPETGAAAPGVGGPQGLAAFAASASAERATSSAVTAATAASVAQAISATASAGATDRHTHGSAADLSLSGTSNDGTAGAAQWLSSGPSASTDAPSTATLKVAPGVDSPEFGQGVADRVSLMVDSNLTSAKLQVNPPTLGPIEVRIALQGGHAQVWFTSHSAVTRDALESSSPKLREMLGAQGFGQVSVDISQRSFQERSPPSKGYEGVPAIGSEPSVAIQASSAPRSASALLDAYA